MICLILLIITLYLLASLLVCLLTSSVKYRDLRHFFRALGILCPLFPCTLFFTYFWRLKITNWALKKSFRSLYFTLLVLYAVFIISMYPFFTYFWHLKITNWALKKSFRSLYFTVLSYTQYLNNYLGQLINLKHIRNI